MTHVLVRYHKSWKRNEVEFVFFLCVCFFFKFILTKIHLYRSCKGAQVSLLHTIFCLLCPTCPYYILYVICYIMCYVQKVSCILIGFSVTLHINWISHLDFQSNPSFECQFPVCFCFLNFISLKKWTEVKDSLLRGNFRFPCFCHQFMNHEKLVAQKKEKKKRNGS